MAGRAFALQVADLGLIPGISYSPPSTARSNLSAQPGITPCESPGMNQKPKVHACVCTDTHTDTHKLKPLAYKTCSWPREPSFQHNYLHFTLI